MAGWGDIFSILNKFIPNRKEKAINELKSLEKELAHSLARNDDLRAATIRSRMRSLREKFPDIAE